MVGKSVQAGENRLKTKTKQNKSAEFGVSPDPGGSPVPLWTGEPQLQYPEHIWSTTLPSSRSCIAVIRVKLQ